VPGDARADSFNWDKDGECLLEGSTTLREINKRLHLQFPLDGPKTLNGLILEYLQEIPDANMSLMLHACILEVVQVQNQAIKVVKILKLQPKPVAKNEN
jgi:Mg2+/Co2+ transporter CorB